MAELEYKIEKDQLDILKISQKIQVIKMNKEKQKYTEQLTRKECLYNYVRYNDVTVLTACEISSENIGSLAIRSEGFGLSVNKDIANGAKLSERVLELNGENMLKITQEDWDIFKSELKYPVEAVSLHLSKSCEGTLFDANNDIHGMRDDITMIKNKFEDKLNEGRNKSIMLEKIQKEKKVISQENTRLHHRIAYLEEHTQDLRSGLKQVILKQTQLSKIFLLISSGQRFPFKNLKL